MVSVGVDIVDVRRIAEAILRFGDRFLERIYTPGEIDYCLRRARQAESFAVRFAAKEGLDALVVKLTAMLKDADIYQE